MIEIEFLADFCCYQRGQRKIVSDGFGQIMVEEGKARIVTKAKAGPDKNKMITDSVNK